MNDRPNTKRWNPGDLVIHDLDAKQPRMLMRVLGYRSSDDFCHTEYVDAELKAEWGAGERSQLFNVLACLHDPALWGIPLDATDEHPLYDRDFKRKTQ